MMKEKVIKILIEIVIGMHTVGKDNLSYELKIDYVKPILDNILSGKDIIVGDIGIDLELIDVNIAMKTYGLTEKYAFDLSNEGMISNPQGVPECLIISSVIEGSASHSKLLPGDILIRLNKVVIGNDLLLLDQIINNKFYSSN